MTNEEEFRPVVQLLLARMKSSPEEFEPTHIKYRHWSSLYDDVESWATEAEKAALYKAAGNIRMEELHHRAMKLILQDKQPEDYDTEEARFKTTERYSAGYTSPMGLFEAEMDAKIQTALQIKENEVRETVRRQNNVRISQVIKDGVERMFNK